MDITIQNINKVVSYTNLVVSKINPYAGVVTSEAAVITQIGTTGVAVVNQTSQGQAELFDINFSVDASVIALTAKIDGFLLALGTAAIYGSGATLAAGTILTAGSLMFALSVTAGVVAVAANQSVRDIITDPQFWDSMKNDGLNGLDNYVKARSGISLSDLLSKLVEAMLTGEISEFSHVISEATATNFTSATLATAPRRSDPLVLDLDNDGLETTGLNATKPIYFDQNADNVKTATGWVSADDAFLVLDKNANGFDALRDLDANTDGKINAGDAQFANLRLWRDLNQDGISQANELFTLGSQNIAAINVGSTAHSQILANGNQLADIGSYVKTDGSSGALGEVTGNLGDINLIQDTFHSQFADHLDTSGFESLPDMHGAGQVRDLREAATLSPLLAQLLNDFATATDAVVQRGLLDQILQAWSDASPMAATCSGAYTGHSLTVNMQNVATGSTAYNALAGKLTILEHFNGRTFNNVPDGTAANESIWKIAA